ncbi:MAG: glycosyltransferase family 1 protein [Actinomycetota bacterium]
MTVTSLAVHTDQLYGDAPGGIGTYIRQLVPALALADQDLDIRLFHARFGREAPEDWMLPYPDVELPATIRSLYPRWNLFAGPALPSPIADTDVIHAPLPAAIPPARDGQRLVVTVHDLAFEHYPEMFPSTWKRLYRMGLRAAAKRAHTIITPSRSTADDLLAHARVPASKIEVVPEAASLPGSGGDPDEVAARLGLQPPYLLSVGTLEPRKNLVRLIQAYRKAVVDGALPHALVLAGPAGWKPDELMREVDAGGPGRVILTGRLSDTDLDVVYRAAWAFAYVSVYEGFGLPVLEAMARGLPVICSNTSSLPEVAGEGALLVDPASVPDMAEAIRRVLSDEHLAGDIAARGMEQSRRFSWDTAARRTLEVYEGS